MEASLGREKAEIEGIRSQLLGMVDALVPFSIIERNRRFQGQLLDLRSTIEQASHRELREGGIEVAIGLDCIADAIATAGAA